jgi:transcriptional regulator of acetoin/glycerol metabolism
MASALGALLAIIPVLDEDGQMARLLAVSVDIAERRAAEADLRSQSAILTDMQDLVVRGCLLAATNGDPAVAVRALKEAGGNRSLAARMLGIDRSMLCAKLRRYGTRP